MCPKINSPVKKKSPLKVTHVVRQYLPSIGGMEEVVRNIAMHQMRTTDHEVRIVTLDKLFRNHEDRLPSIDKIDGIDIVRLPYFGSSRYPLCPSVFNALGDADVIHVHGVDFFYDFLAATRWIHKRPLMLSTHGGFFHTHFASRAKLAYFNTVTRLSSHAYQRIVATSANDGQLFGQIMKQEKLEVIENGVNVEKYADQSATELKPTLIYFGRWSSNKGLLEAIPFFSQLYQKKPEWRLIIAGREYDHSLEELQNCVNALGLNQAITLAANPSDQEIRELLQQASYFLCLSQHEGFGIAPIEAMSAGLTPILSDIPPFKVLIENSHLGFMRSASTTIESSIAQLLVLHEQGDKAYAVRRIEAMQFAKHYAWPKVADRYLALYEQLGSNRLEKAS